MNAGGERLTTLAGFAPGTRPLQDLDQDTALGLAETLSRFPGGQGRLSFLDARLLIRCLVSPSLRAALTGHVVLPSGGFLSSLLLRAMGMRKPVCRFTPSEFIPALLTYAERPLRVVVDHTDHTDRGLAASLCTRLAQHAPWHSVVTRSQDDSRPCDLLVVLGSDGGRAGREHPRANLTVFAGRTSLGR